MMKEKRLTESRTSERSIRSTGSSKTLKERIEKFEDEKNSADRLQEIEYAKRREKRKQLKQLLKQDRKLTYYNISFVISCAVFAAGTAMTVGSTIRGLGEGSLFFSHKEVFIVIGPCLLSVALVSCVVTSTLSFNRKTKVMQIKAEAKELNRKHDIRLDSERRRRRRNKSQGSLSRQSSRQSSVSLGESGDWRGKRSRWSKRSQDCDTISNCSCSVTSPTANGPPRFFLSPLDAISSSQEGKFCTEEKVSSEEVNETLPLHTDASPGPVRKFSARTRREKWKMSKLVSTSTSDKKKPSVNCGDLPVITIDKSTDEMIADFTSSYSITVSQEKESKEFPVSEKCYDTLALVHAATNGSDDISSTGKVSGELGANDTMLYESNSENPNYNSTESGYLTASLNDSQNSWKSGMARGEQPQSKQPLLSDIDYHGDYDVTSDVNGNTEDVTGARHETNNNKSKTLKDFKRNSNVSVIIYDVNCLSSSL